MVDLALVEGFVDVVAGGDEEEGGKDEGEGGEGCGVEDAEEGNAGVGVVHGKYIGVGCMIEIMMLGSGWEIRRGRIFNNVDVWEARLRFTEITTGNHGHKYFTKFTQQLAFTLDTLCITLRYPS